MRHPEHPLAVGIVFLRMLILAPMQSQRLVESLYPEIHPSLPPSALRTLWKTGEWGRGLLRGAVLTWLLLTPLVAACTMLMLGADIEAASWGVLYGVLLAAAGTAVITCTLGLGSAMPGGLAIAPVFGLALGVALQKMGGVQEFAVAFQELSTVAAIGAGPASVVALGPLAGAIISVGVGISGYFAGSPFAGSPDYSASRQVAGVVIGVLASAAIYGFAVTVALTIFASSSSVLHICGLFGGLVFAGLALAMTVRGAAWRKAFRLAAAVAVPWTALAWAARELFVEAPAAVLAAGMCTAGFYATFFALSFAVAERYGGAQAGAVASATGSGGAFVVFVGSFRGDVDLWIALPLSLVGVAIGLAFPRLFPLITYPFECAWNVALHRMEERRTRLEPSLLKLNSAFWNELQWLPLPGLTAHLLLLSERGNPDAGPAMRAIAESRQRQAASTVQLELDARSIEACKDIEAIRRLQPRLEAEDRESPLRAFGPISRDVEVAISQTTGYHTRLILEKASRDLDFSIQSFTRAGDRVSVRFLPGMWQWRDVIQNFRDNMAALERSQDKLINPFVPGLPVTEQQEVFVGRTELSGKIAGHLLADNAPPLLLYGQRRMGKTSLLNNLRRLLPSSIVPLFVDLQAVALADNDRAFIYALHRAMSKRLEKEFGSAISRLPRQEFYSDPYTRLDEWFDEIEEVQGGRTLLLALDELEALDRAIVDRRVREEGVTSLLRHLVQHRRQWRVLVAASHTINELRHWASRLINLQVVSIGYLKEEEARQLIEKPVGGFPLRYSPGTIERIFAATRGHPWLVQQVCWELVELKNNQDVSLRSLATLTDTEAAFPRALDHGYLVFADMLNRLAPQAEVVLRYIANQERQASVSIEDLNKQFRFNEGLAEALNLLVERQLVEQIGPIYRVQVELVSRWLAESRETARSVGTGGAFP